MFSFQFFVNYSTNSKKKYYIKGTMILYIFDVFLFFLIGVVERSFQDIITGTFLVFWLVLTVLLFNKFNFKFITIVYYTLFLTILAILEESIIYFNGGGLSGTATSLTQDLVIAVPVFVFLGVSLFILSKYLGLDSSDLYIYGSLFGFLIEILIGGKIVLFYLFGGPALVIYGSMIATFAPKRINENKIQYMNSYLKILIVLIVMFIFMILGAIVGDTAYRML